MKAFISYSTRQKKHATVVKGVLEEIGVDSFLAHETLQISEDWKKRILLELRTCKIFVPLLSKAFKSSAWCDQETGIISRRRGVLIMPFSLDGTTPYGFISYIQGKRLSDGKLERSQVLDAVARKWPSFVIDRLLKPMEKVYSFRQAENVVQPLVPYFPRFTATQARTFADLATKNGQIWDADLCREEYLPKFLRAQKGKISKERYLALRHQIHNGRRPETKAA
jgi:hypothetical protein